MAAEPGLRQHELHQYWSSLLGNRTARQVSEAGVLDVDPEGYEYWTEAQRHVAVNREQALVADFCRYLKRNGWKYTSRTVRLESGAITCDVYDETRGILFEAKANAKSRSQIRMAIGQLFDYAYFGFESQRLNIRKSVLLPERPSEDILELLTHLQLGVAWKASKTDFEELAS